MVLDVVEKPIGEDHGASRVLLPASEALFLVLISSVLEKKKQKNIFQIIGVPGIVLAGFDCIEKFTSTAMLVSTINIDESMHEKHQINHHFMFDEKTATEK